jgi:hypothetical protein
MEDNRKDQRKQKFVDKAYRKEHVSDEQRFVSKSKKQFKRHQQDLRAEELWEDWENEVH